MMLLLTCLYNYVSRGGYIYVAIGISYKPECSYGCTLPTVTVVYSHSINVYLYYV